MTAPGVREAAEALLASLDNARLYRDGSGLTYYDSGWGVDEAADALKAALSRPSAPADTGHRLAPAVTHQVVCVCGEARSCGESWWLVERRDVTTPEYLTFTGCNPPSWVSDAWKAQRFTRESDARSEAATVMHITGFKVEAVAHGFVGGDRIIAETRCPACGSVWLKSLPSPSAPAGGEAVVEALKVRCGDLSTQGDQLITEIDKMRDRLERQGDVVEAAKAWRGVNLILGTPEDMALREAVDALPPSGGEGS